MKKKILVTGGAGFIGSHTVVALHEAGYEPVILDNFCNSKFSVLDKISEICGTHIKHIPGNPNVFDRALIRSVFEEDQFDGIIHFAALKAVNESLYKPLEYYYNNVSGLIILLQEMEMSEYPIDNFVFSSSCTVYQRRSIGTWQTLVIKS